MRTQVFRRMRETTTDIPPDKVSGSPGNPKSFDSPKHHAPLPVLVVAPLLIMALNAPGSPLAPCH